MILVTGATGKVGSEVARQLHARGVPVRALVRSPEKARELLPEGVELARGDLGDPASLDEAMRGVERLFLLSAPDPRQVEWERNAVEAARRAGVRHVVKLSVVGASEDSPVQLARWHRESEKEIAASGLAWTFVQPTFFAQNFLNFAESVRGEGVIHAAIHGRASYVDVRDIAAVAVAALTEPGHEGKTYVVTGPEALSYEDAAERISAAVGKPVRYVEVPAEAVRGGMVAAGMPEWYADDLAALSEVINQGWAEGVSDAVATVAGREPIRFERFARDHAAAFGGS